MRIRNDGNQEPEDWRKTELRSKVQQATKSTATNQYPNNRTGDSLQEGGSHPGTTSSAKEKGNVDRFLRVSVESPVDRLPIIPLEKSDPQAVVNPAPIGSVPNRASRRRKRLRTAPTPPDKILLTGEEAAYMLDLEPESLAVFRSTGRHQIPFIKIGRNVRYRRSDLEAWLQSHTHANGTTVKEES